MANTAITKRAQDTQNFMNANGYNNAGFNSKGLQSHTKKLYEYMAKGELALWDMAAELSGIKTDIAAGMFTEKDPEISSFSAYCESIGLDKSNMSKYVRAYNEYGEIRYAGFSLSIAVALIGSDIEPDDFVKNFTPLDISARELKKMIKERKQQLLEDSSENDADTDTDTENSDGGNNTANSEPEQTKEPEFKFNATDICKLVELAVKAAQSREHDILTPEQYAMSVEEINKFINAHYCD